MQTVLRAVRRTWQATAMATAVVALTGCGVTKQSQTPLLGPSEFGLSVTMTASPSMLPRDGVSTSEIRVTVRDPQAKPVSGQRLALSVSAGTLSVGEVTTGSNGVATFDYTAPNANAPVTSADIGATPFGSNFANATTRIVTVGLIGPGVPTPSFTSTPVSPKRFELATLDASATTVNGTVCGGACLYSWSIGSEATLSGQIVTYRFRAESVYMVTLTVTSPGGAQATMVRPVTVAAAALPALVITASPTAPKVGQLVQFDARSSTVPDGATIESYAWDFGVSGQTGNAVTGTASYPAAGAYTVRLTVVDSYGRTATLAQPITVSN